MRNPFPSATCYHGSMERVVDKTIVLICCLTILVSVSWEPVLLVAMLVAIGASALSEMLPERVMPVPSLAFSLVALVLPPFAVFLPLSVYDLARDEHAVVRLVWLLPMLVTLVRSTPISAVAFLLACAVAFILSLRTCEALRDRAVYRQARDELREASLALEGKNKGLREKQDLEVRLATLAERGRIAREIHDNVGHLLTRSIMQVEALQVVHRADEQVCGELSQVGVTLHEAMDTVRASVHDLHDDAFDLESQINEVAAGSSLEVHVDYHADEVPLEVGYGLVSIVREALSNSVRHGDADSASVSIVAYPAFYRLIVHDNGTIRPPSPVLDGFDGGFGRSGDRSKYGMGLASMADRTRALGGVLRVEYDHGFKVFVTIPKDGQS